MLKKTILAALLATAGVTALAAADYYVVVPMPGKAASGAATIALTLHAATLPPGQLSQAYSYDLNTLLSVTGDAAFNPANVAWRLTSGALPAGITLTNGVLSGTPTVKNEAGSGVQVEASYKTKSGQQAYTIMVNGVALQVTSIASGATHTCAVTTVGGVKCWGDNSSGQLGTGDQESAFSPVSVPGLVGATSVTAGMTHTCAVVAGGVKCWGYGGDGQLGGGNWNTSLVPAAVPGLTNVAIVSASSDNTCAVTTAGAAFCWGANGSGQVGDGSTTWRNRATSVSGLEAGVAGISVGDSHACALTTTGGVKCWGGNSDGQLGDNSVVTRLTPVDVTGLTAGAAVISAGSAATCAVTTAGGAKCWGTNNFGQVGDGTTTSQKTPAGVTGLASGVKTIATGGGQACAVTTGGTTFCWGNNDYGQLGIGTADSSNVPVQLTVAPVASLALGWTHSCARTMSGIAKCWGSGTNGNLGTGQGLDASTPMDVLP